HNSHDKLTKVLICTQFLEAENIPVLAWPAYTPDMSPIEHMLHMLWIDLDRFVNNI
uniref:Tc1-like transposase DDE domain-containing protein n=1 Tax=Sinocyclocheilus rhinocerous TaxID=307959 RepID=A0A673H4K9_9TELE